MRVVRARCAGLSLAADGPLSPEQRELSTLAHSSLTALAKRSAAEFRTAAAAFAPDVCSHSAPTVPHHSCHSHAMACTRLTGIVALSCFQGLVSLWRVHSLCMLQVRTRMETALREQAAAAAPQACGASASAAPAAGAPPKIALKMDFSSFGKK
jgi:hypothetical protein